MCIIIVFTLLLLLAPARDQAEPQRYFHLQGWSRLESCDLALEEISHLHCLFPASRTTKIHKKNPCFCWIASPWVSPLKGLTPPPPPPLRTVSAAIKRGVRGNKMGGPPEVRGELPAWQTDGGEWSALEGWDRSEGWTCFGAVTVWDMDEAQHRRDKGCYNNDGVFLIAFFFLCVLF